MKKVLVILLALTLVIGVVGCGAPAESSGSDTSKSAESNESKDNKNTASGDKVTIRFVSQHTRSDENRAGVWQAIDDYAKKVSDKYILEHEPLQNDEVKAKIKIDLAADTCPDIFFYWNAASDLSSMIKADVLLPIEEYINHPDATLNWDMFTEASKFTVLGEEYGFSMEAHYGAWLANKKLFEKYGLEYPKTYDDIIELAKTFSANGITTVATGCKGGNPGHWFIDEIYYQIEGANEEMTAIPETGKVATDKFLYALKYFEKMRDAGCFPSDTVSNGDWMPNFSYYNEGRAALIPAYGWQLSAMSDECYEWTEIIPSPHMTDDGDMKMIDTSKNKLFQVGHGALFISKDRWNEGDAKQAAIVDFYNYYFSDDMFVTRWNDAGYAPTKIIKDFDYSSGLPIIQDIIAFENKNSLTKIHQMHMLTIPDSTVWADYQTSMDEFFSGAISAEEYMAKVQESMDNNYNK